VIPGYPHHVTQRGNRQQQGFFSDEDYRQYIDLMAEFTEHVINTLFQTPASL